MKFDNSKEMPYKVDPSYFSQMQSAVMDRLKSDEEASPSADLIDSVPPFKKPDSNYFSSMQAAVLAKTSSQSDSQNEDLIENTPYSVPEGYSPAPRLKKQKVYNMRKQNRFSAISVAATFLMIVLLGSIYIQSNNKVQVNSESMAYMNDINQSDWSNFLEEEESIKLDGEGKDPEINLDDVSDREVLDYLEEEQYLEQF